MRRGSDHSVALCTSAETSFSRRPRTSVRAGHLRMASGKDSAPVAHCGQVGTEFLSNHEGWAARSFFADCI